MKRFQPHFFYFAAVLLVGWLLWPGAGPAAANPAPIAQQIRTLPNPSGVDIEIRLGEYAFAALPSGSEVYDSLVFDGQNGILKAPGTPEMPVLDLLIGVPASGDITLRFTSANMQALTGRLNLAPAPVPAPLEEDLTAGEMIRSDIHTLAVSEPGLYPAEQAVIAGEAWIRGQRVIRLQISPFQYNPAAKTATFTPDFDIHVLFSEPVQAACLDCTHDAEFEDVLQDQLINYEQSRGWRVTPGSAEMRELIQSPLTSSFLGPRYEIVVDQDGVYRLTYADLLAAGMDVDSVDPRKFKLFNHGNQVRIRVSGESDGSFDPGDYVIFYGEKFRGDIMEARYQSSMTRAGNVPNDPAYAANNWFWQCRESCELAGYFERYTDDNVYYLLAAPDEGLRMATVSGTPAGAAVPTVFTTTVKAEKSNQWLANEFYDEDIWFWRRNQIEQISPTYPINSNYPGIFRGVKLDPAYTASIYLEFYTGSHNIYAANDYHTQFSLNGFLFADNFWDGMKRFTLSADVPQDKLLDGTNTLELSMLSTAFYAQKLYFDFYEITYARDFSAFADQLAFTYPQGGPWRFQVSGLMSPAVEVLEISDPFNPVQVLNVAIVDNSGTYTAEFEVTTGPQAAYIVAGNGTGVLAPRKISAYNPPDFAALAPADYILITHADFITSTQALADYRAAQGYTVAVIDVNDLYHEFNDGIYHPIAIKNFLAYAFANWSSPPLYVTLVGSGNWNMKNVGDGTKTYHNAPPSYMPPNLAYIDPWQGEVDSANLLATVIGDDAMPDVYIARIPVSSDAQMATVVSKITAYESAPLTGWQNNILFIADNVPDPSYAGDFVALSEGIIAEYLTENYPYQALRIYEDTGGLYPSLPDFDCTASGSPQCINAKNAIINTLNISGTLVLNYTGHASLNYWSGEQIFRTDAVDQLTNDDQLPVILSMTCLDGHWTYPNFDSLAYRFLTRPGGGAVATFSPTGLGVASGHDYLQRGFYDSLFKDGSWELGPATLSAKLSLWGSGWDYDLLHTFILFGDPATGVRVMDKTFLPAVIR